MLNQMSFMLRSVLGDNSAALNVDASLQDLSNKALGLTGFDSQIPMDKEGWPANVWSQVKRNGDNFLTKLQELCSSVQPISPSSIAHSSNAWKILLKEKIQSSQFYFEASEWLSSTFEKIPSLHQVSDQIQNVTVDDERMMEELNGLEDLSDVVKDMIKTIKVLITFEAMNDVQNDMLVPHFNIQPVAQDKQRNIRRYIGRI